MNFYFAKRVVLLFVIAIVPSISGRLCEQLTLGRDDMFQIDEIKEADDRTFCIRCKYAFLKAK